MKLFMATLATETNTFSPMPTGEAGFKGGRDWFRHDGSRHPPTIGNIPLIVWRACCDRDGHELVESICSFAQPAGTTLRHVYEGLRDLLLGDLEARMADGPFDGVLLFMHGAMVADGYDDCEGDTLARVRALVGPDAKIGIELDLHCHLTELMRTSADVIVTYKEYPHVDIAARAHEVYDLVTRAVRHEIVPVIAYHDCGMVAMWRTSVEPMRSFVDRMSALEGRDGILSVSFGHGFPWGDVEDVGAKIVVVGDGDAAPAQALAARLGREIWDIREQTLGQHDSIDEAIDHVAAFGGRTGPVVLADVADNAGGGAPSDNTAILARLVERGVKNAVVGCFWDPVAVGFCSEAGEGASFTLRIGGKCGVASGDPLDLKVTVMRVLQAHSQAGLSGGRLSAGPSAWVRSGGIDIALVSVRQQTFSPDAFTGLGITLEDKAMVVVKSTQHFHAAFAPVAAEIRYVSVPGAAIPPDFAHIAFTKRTRPYWPRVADPFATNSRQSPGS